MIIPEPGLILCFSHFMTHPCLTRELDFPGVVNVRVNLSIPVQPPHLQASSRASHRLLQPDTVPSSALQGCCPCQAWSSLDFLPRWQSCPASLCRVTAVPLHWAGSRAAFPAGQRCHCQRAAVPQQCIFGNLWTLQLKMCQKYLGRVQETWSTLVLAYLLTLWPDSVNKTWFDSPQLNWRG